MEFGMLNNGVKIPRIGYGVYQTPRHETVELVRQAISMGYKHIDTAQNYSNEKEVGKAIRESDVEREEVFVTTKTQSTGYESTTRSIDKSLDEFGFDYFDLILIHWPNLDNTGTYRALEEALAENKCRAIGLSNFNSQQFIEVSDNCDVKPAVNQIETHILWQQKRMHEFLRRNDCMHESWSPFSSGNFNLFDDDTLTSIAETHERSVAQIILRFLTLEDIIVIPKSTSKERMQENIDIFDFKLTSDEIMRIEELDQNQSYCNWPYSMQEEAV